MKVLKVLLNILQAIVTSAIILVVLGLCAFAINMLVKVQ